MQQCPTTATSEACTDVILTFSILLMITSLLLIVLVLLHKGRGGGLSDMFGGGVSTNLGRLVGRPSATSTASPSASA